MHTREIEIFQLARPEVNGKQLEEWLECMGVSDPSAYPLPDSPASSIIGLAAKRCYMSFEVGLNPNITKIRKDWDRYLLNLLSSGHGSVLEHGMYTYAIEGCTRVLTAELNRHRAGVATSEGSMRFIRYDDIPYWVPESVKHRAGSGMFQRIQTREIFCEVFEFVESKYKELMHVWGLDDPDGTMPFSRKKQLTSLFRRIIPMGVSTGGVWSFNIRALRHIITMRSDPAAEEEIALVASMLCKDILSSEPFLFNDFTQDDNGFWKPEHRKV